MDAAYTAQVEKLRAALQRAVMDTEAWRRVCVVLTQSVLNDRPLPEIDGHVGVLKAEMDEVPRTFTASLGVAKMAAEPVDGEEDGEPEDVVLVLVENAKEGGNGAVARVERPRIVLPGGGR